MPIPAPFQIRLQSYGIDSDTETLRLELGVLLTPIFQELVSNQIGASIIAVPFYAEHVRRHRSGLEATVLKYTRKLFTDPFDEEWVNDSIARAEYEANLGFDMRTRGTVNRFLLTGILKICQRKTYSVNRYAAWADAVTRIMMLDAANAVACHNNLAVKKGAERSLELDKAIEAFSTVIIQVRLAVTHASRTLIDTSSKLSGLSERAGERAKIASNAAFDAASSIDTTAAATEELSVAIENIHGQARESEEVAKKAVDQASSSDAAIHRLDSAVNKIGDVVNLISSIAAQTNLLALNATIEAARAGDAGRGFAIVASEVKALSLQTAKATTDIGEEIATVQQATKHSIEELEGVGSRISQIATFAQSVAGSVEAQSTATSEIAQSAGQAAAFAGRVSDELNVVESIIKEASHEAHAVSVLAKDLNGRGIELERAFAGLLEITTQQQQVLEDFVDLSSPATMTLEGRRRVG